MLRHYSISVHVFEKWHNALIVKHKSSRHSKRQERQTVVNVFNYTTAKNTVKYIRWLATEIIATCTSRPTVS